MKITEPHYSVLTVSTKNIRTRYTTYIKYSIAFSMNKPGSLEMHLKLKTFASKRGPARGRGRNRCNFHITIIQSKKYVDGELFTKSTQCSAIMAQQKIIPSVHNFWIDVYGNIYAQYFVCIYLCCKYLS